MTRAITALFDSRSEAETARQRLVDAGLGADASIRDQLTSSISATGESTGGFWSSLKDMFVSDDDRHTYAHGISQGGFLLSAHVDEARADEAVGILDTAGSVDLDTRENEWRTQGYGGRYAEADGTTSSSTGTGIGAAIAGAADSVKDALTGRDGDDTMRGARAMGGGDTDERIPVIQESLRVGKREVGRGTVRVRSYVVETPVEEDVSLRTEHVSVERRAVDQPLAGNAADMLRERSFEMTETREEAVVSKDARVVEEVVVHKGVTDRVEHVSDTVRRTEVDVDRDGDMATGTRSGIDSMTGTRSDRI